MQLWSYEITIQILDSKVLNKCKLDVVLGEIYLIEFGLFKQILVTKLN